MMESRMYGMLYYRRLLIEIEAVMVYIRKIG